MVGRPETLDCSELSAVWLALEGSMLLAEHAGFDIRGQAICNALKAMR
jgi:hypothetical protein